MNLGKNVIHIWNMRESSGNNTYIPLLFASSFLYSLKHVSISIPVGHLRKLKIVELRDISILRELPGSLSVFLAHILFLSF